MNQRKSIIFHQTDGGTLNVFLTRVIELTRRYVTSPQAQIKPEAMCGEAVGYGIELIACMQLSSV